MYTQPFHGHVVCGLFGGPPIPFLSLMEWYFQVGCFFDIQMIVLK